MGLQSVMSVKRRLSDGNCIAAYKNKKLMAFWSEELKDEDEEISDEDIDAEFEDEEDEDEEMDSDETPGGDSTLPSIGCLTKINNMDTSSTYSYDKPGYEAESNENLPHCRYSGYPHQLWSNPSETVSDPSYTSAYQDSAIMTKSHKPSHYTSSPWQSPAYNPSYSSDQPPRCTVTTDSSGNKRIEEAGKSYLEIGSYNTYSNGIKHVPQRHNQCSNRQNTTWTFSNHPFRQPQKTSCYSHKRLEVLNISLWKLKRFRSSGNYSELSLHKSVLICNTLRSIEREMEREGMKVQPVSEKQDSRHSGMELGGAPGGFCPTPNYQMLPPPVSVDNPPVYHPIGSNFMLTNSYNHDDKDSSEDSESINWSSVLSLSTQSDMDVTSDSGVNDLLSSSRTSSSSVSSYSSDQHMCDTEAWKLTPINADTLLPPSSPEVDPLESLMKVMVGI